ncbi:carbohydrate ABC transporter permease [Pseudoroseicyclus sp. H15]
MATETLDPTADPAAERVLKPKAVSNDDGMAGETAGLTWAVHISVVLLVLLWIFPTVGLLISSFRTADQIATTGWWKALFPSEQSLTYRTDDPDDVRIEAGDGIYVVEGNVFAEGSESTISAWGVSSRDVAAYELGDTADLGDGETLTLVEGGDYVWRGNDEQISGNGQRIFVTATVPPQFTLRNYDTVLGRNVLLNLIIYAVAGTAVGFVAYYAARSSLPGREKLIGWGAGIVVALGCIFIFGLSEGTVSGAQTSDSMAKAFFNTMTVTIPATIIPIVIAAFAAYALAWMDFPGRALLIAFIVGLLVVPLQLALIPLLRLHLEIGIGKGYLGVWLAHTGFGLPLAVYLLRNYMVGLPRDIIENAKVDGATDFQIFVRIILPLSFPALASFAIFQFLWTWNDLLVAKVFLIDSTGDTTVMTNQIVELLGTRGGNWEILATAAFVSIAVPLVVFFAMQKYLVRGLLAGSVK